MKRLALIGWLVPAVVLAQTVVPQDVNAAPAPVPVAAEPVPAPAPEAVAPAPEAPQVVAAPEPAPDLEQRGCRNWKAPGLNEGPIALGYVDADVATGRRVCPRTEAGIGGRGAAVIDTPNFYGYLLVEAIIYGSVAIGEKTEVFGTLEALHWYYTAQNGPLKIPANNATLGTLTLGVTRHIYGTNTFLGALSGRLLLPTSLAVPNAKIMGAEIGHASTWRPKSWLEVHSYLGLDFDAAIGSGPALPHFGAVLTVGAQFSPVSFASLVLDASGRVGPKTYFAPTVALRFRVSQLGIELAGTLPLAGTDRHLFIAGARFNLRI